MNNTPQLALTGKCQPSSHAKSGFGRLIKKKIRGYKV